MPSQTAASSSPVLLAPGAETPLPLSLAPVGRRRVVVQVDGPDRADLEREGVVPGSMVVVTGRTPLGGPLVVELGRARIALSAKIAAQVATLPIPATARPAATERPVP